MKYLLNIIIALLLTTMVSAQDKASTKNKIREANIGGYMILKVDKVDTTFNAGYSMYAAAFPLVKEYPGRSFQSGLFGSWMFPQNNSPLTK